MNFNQAKDLLANARGTTKKLKLGTILRQEGTDFVISYHNTDVVTMHEDGTYTLRNGGWQTNTTKARINEYSPARVFADKGLWYVQNAKYVLGDYNGIDNRSLFEDGMKVDDSGRPLNITKGLQKATERAKRTVDMQVRAYIKGFRAHVMKNGLEDAGAGDCFGCQLKPENDPEGEAFGVSHYFAHFEEKYYVPSLLVNAFAECYEKPQYPWQMAVADIANGREPYFLDLVLRKYFRKRKAALIDYMLKEQQRQAA